MIDVVNDSNVTQKSQECEIDFDKTHRPSRQTGGKYNKSIDFDRHGSMPRRTRSGCKKNTEVFGDSYATLGESFMGESFANLGEQSFAMLALCGDDDSDDEEANDYLKQIAMKSLLDQPDLHTVVVFEEEDGIESQTHNGNKN
jgi:hypothetical protein